MPEVQKANRGRSLLHVPIELIPCSEVCGRRLYRRIEGGTERNCRLASDCTLRVVAWPLSRGQCAASSSWDARLFEGAPAGRPSYKETGRPCPGQAPRRAPLLQHTSGCQPIRLHGRPFLLASSFPKSAGRSPACTAWRCGRLGWHAARRPPCSLGELKASLLIDAVDATRHRRRGGRDGGRGAGARARRVEPGIEGPGRRARGGGRPGARGPLPSSNSNSTDTRRGQGILCFPCSSWCCCGFSLSSGLVLWKLPGSGPGSASHQPCAAGQVCYLPLFSLTAN